MHVLILLVSHAFDPVDLSGLRCRWKAQLTFARMTGARTHARTHTHPPHLLIGGSRVADGTMSMEDARVRHQSLLKRQHFGRDPGPNFRMPF